MGIDPGIKNLGMAITRDSGELMLSTTYSVPQYHGNTNKLINSILAEADSYGCKNIHIERFVPYAGKNIAISEEILMLIGGLRYSLQDLCYSNNVVLIRAIDWKPVLCKYLYKKYKFKNPSKTFDKKFSMAAAEIIIDGKPKNDHEADAICLSHLWAVER